MNPYIVIVTLVLVLGAPVFGGGARAEAQETVPVVVASGEGLVKAAPDQAWITAATEARAKAPKDAQQQVAKAMTAVQEKLAAAGLPKDAIRTVSYDVHPEFDWVDGKQVARGYVARNAIEVRVDEVTRVGELLDVIVGSGATTVQNLRFDLKARETHEREALRRAVADARGRADAMAAGAGRAIDRILRIEEPGLQVSPPPMPMYAARASMEADAKVSTPVVAGEIEIRAQVTLTAALK